MVIRDRSFCWGERTYVMGIINVTSDSFSGDGVGADPAAAVRLALRMEAEGADVLDIGAESSRPGAAETPSGEEIARLMPALNAVRAATELPISVDTYHAETAKRALSAGADMINDIFGLQHDDGAMAQAIAASGARVVAMHNQRGRPDIDVVAGIGTGFDGTIRLAQRAGIDASRLIIDPGFGFGWSPEQNLEMLRRLPELWRFGLPLLVGVSRKSTIGLVLDAPVDDRFAGTAAAVAVAIAGGADIVRVHDVGAMKRVALVSDAILRGRWRTE
jgi:dihydropteroate synthase